MRAFRFLSATHSQNLPENPLNSVLTSLRSRANARILRHSTASESCVFQFAHVVRIFSEQQRSASSDSSNSATIDPFSHQNSNQSAACAPLSDVQCPGQGAELSRKRLRRTAFPVDSIGTGLNGWTDLFYRCDQFFPGSPPRCGVLSNLRQRHPV